MSPHHRRVYAFRYGKLPVTSSKTLDDAIKITSDLDAQYEEGLDVGHRGYDEHKLSRCSRLGMGWRTRRLSWAVWPYDGRTLAPGNGSVVCSTTLTNTGTVAAAEVVQLYVLYPEAAKGPPKLLKAFAKIHVEAGQSTGILLEVLLDGLRIWAEQKENWESVHGEYSFLVGFSASDMETQGKWVFQVC